MGKRCVSVFAWCIFVWVEGVKIFVSDSIFCRSLSFRIQNCLVSARGSGPVPKKGTLREHGACEPGDGRAGTRSTSPTARRAQVHKCTSRLSPRNTSRACRKTEGGSCHEDRRAEAGQCHAYAPACDIRNVACIRRWRPVRCPVRQGVRGSRSGVHRHGRNPERWQHGRPAAERRAATTPRGALHTVAAEGLAT